MEKCHIVKHRPHRVRVNEFLIAPLFLAAFGGFFSLVLAVADHFLSVAEDPKVEIVERILPGLNCGGCGFSSCNAYAKAIIEGKAEAGLCAPGGESALRMLNSIFSQEVRIEKKVAVVKCSGGSSQKFSYKGPPSCSAAVLVGGGLTECSYGCLGLADCVNVCPFGAIGIGANGAAVVSYDKCTGCGLCVSACPRNLIEITPVAHPYFVACSSRDAAEVKKYCKNGCFTCGICTGKKFNPDEVLVMKDNLPVVVWEKARDISRIETAVAKCPAKVWKKMIIKTG